MPTKKSFSRFISIFVLISFVFSSTGCARLKPAELQQYAYHGEATFTEGERILPVDILGNIFGALGKLILWNWKVHRHWITADTQKAVTEYLAKNPEAVGDLKIRYNEYAPIDSLSRLFANKNVKWPYRYTIGFLTTLISDTILIDRIFGGDRYNPFTHTVHLHSDIPAVALHEIGHAADFNSRRYKGSYALLRMLPLADLYQEYQASKTAFDYVTVNHLDQTKIEAYNILYPAYGTYLGGYFLVPYASWAGALVGHGIGRHKSSEFKKQLEAAKS